MKKKFFKNVLALFFGLFISIVVFEIFLRIYNPLNTRLKGDKIIIPIKQQLRYTNKENKKLDSVIYNTKNSLGFRGKEMPKDIQNYTSIIAIGGSTTECMFINDGKDWPNKLGEDLNNSGIKTWVNNAGLDGHSTYGHIILLQDYVVKLHPNYILFLIGINDIGRGDLKDNEHDVRNVKGSYYSFTDFLIKNSEIASTIYNIKRAKDAKKLGLPHNTLLNLTTEPHIPFDSAFYKSEMNRNIRLVENYKKRIQKLIDICKQNKITPIILSQPVLYGKGIDPTTKVNLETIKIYENMNGKLHWDLVKLYNNASQRVCNENDVHFIDLAAELPKDSKYYYDFVHYDNEGCNKVSEIISKNLIENELKDHSHK
jgi:lysophospholipase L1-like esterase